MAREHKTKKKHKLAGFSTTTHLVTSGPKKKVEVNKTTQKLRDLSETEDEGDDTPVALRKMKSTIKKKPSPTPKRDKVTRQPIIPFEVPKRVKIRVTKANPKIVEKEWIPPSPPSSSSNENNDDPISQVQTSPPTTTKQHLPLYPIHLERFTLYWKKNTPLANA